MDSNLVKSLKAAYEATPDNIHLLPLLLQALVDAGDVRQAYDYLKTRKPDQWPELADRRIAVQVCLAVGEYYHALAFAKPETPEILLLKARAFLGLEMKARAREAYEKAIAANPALEDAELSAALSLRPAPPPEPPPETPAAFQSLFGDPTGEEPPRLPNIAHDDTTDDDLARLLVPDEDPVCFAEVGGLEPIKQEIRRRIITPFLKPGLFERFKKRIGGGILLYGPPGCGKTLLARATAGECHARFFNVAITDVLSMWVGQSEDRLHALFEKARADSPAVLFFDEIEALGGKRQYHQDSVSSKLVSQFLSEMDGFARNNHGVLVLAATNVPWAVDPAFRRPGRFDRVLFVPPPDREARETILRILLRGRPGERHIDTALFARQTSGFSGADLSNLIEQAADLAIEASIAEDREVPLEDRHLKEALLAIKPTTLEWLTTARNYARYANEAGHYDEVLEFLRRHGKE